MISEKEFLELKATMLQERMARLEAESFIGQKQYDADKDELVVVTSRLEQIKSEELKKCATVEK